MHEYMYEGPVMEFDTCINRKWKATTYAVSERKARSNLTYRYKREHGKTSDAVIKLPGKITLVE
jgi:hypothetical protein